MSAYDRHDTKDDGAVSSTVPLNDMTERRTDYSGAPIQQPANAQRNPYMTVDTNQQDHQNAYSYDSSSTNGFSPDVEKHAGNEEALPEQVDQNSGRTRSMRSFFSGRKSHESNQSNKPKQQEGDDAELLPIDEEGEEDEDEDGVMDIDDVMNGEFGSGGDKKRGHTNIKRGSKRKAPSKVIKALRKFYVDLVSKTLFTRSLVYWFPLALILFIPLAVGAWASIDASIGNTRIMWLFIWLEIVWASLWVSRFLAHCMPSIYKFLVGIVAPGFKKYSTILTAVELPLSYVFWALISMCTFTPVLVTNEKAQPGKNSQQEWDKVVQNILVALMISSLVYLAERLFIHFLSVSFHKTRFAKRIKDNKLAIRMLTKMLDAAYTVFPQYCQEFQEDDLQLEAGALMNQGKNIPVGFARKLVANNNVKQVVGNLNRVVGGAAKVLGNVGRDIRGNFGEDSNDTYNTVIDGLANRHLAEILARRIWLSLVLEGADELTLEDFVEVVGEANRADCEYLFTTLDSDGNGNLTLEEMVSSVQLVSKERKTIFKSLRDVDSAIGKLHSVLLAVVVLIMIIIFIGMLAPSVSSVLATLGAALLASSFVFSPTAQEILGSCVFLFVKHPFDVGDIVSITTQEGPTRLVVVEISLLFTVFSFLATGMQTQAPNATLNTLWIDNVTRSGHMTTPFTLNLGLPETTLEDIDKLKEKLDAFLEENNRDYMPDPYFNVIDMPNLDRIQLYISITFKSNQHDGILYGMRRTRMFQFLAQCVHEIPLHIPRRDETYNNSGLPVMVAGDSSMLPKSSGGDDDDDNNNGGAPTRPTGMRTRPPMGFKPPQAPTFDFEEQVQHPTDEKHHQVDATHLAPMEGGQDSARASGSALGRLNSMASRASSLGRKKTVFTGRRRRGDSMNTRPAGWQQPQQQQQQQQQQPRQSEDDDDEKRHTAAPNEPSAHVS